MSVRKYILEGWKYLLVSIMRIIISWKKKKKVPGSDIDSDVMVQPTVFNGLGMVAFKPPL